MVFSYQTEWQWDACFHSWKTCILGIPASHAEKILAGTKMTEKSGKKTDKKCFYITIIVLIATGYQQWRQFQVIAGLPYVTRQIHNLNTPLEIN